MKNELIKVDGEKNLFRDPQTNAILNNNQSDYFTYMKRRESKNKDKEKIENIENEIFSLKEDIGEIKNLLRGLLNGNGV